MIDRLEEELNAIRLNIYEKIRDMTPEEEVAYINSRAEPLIRQYGFQVGTLQAIETERQVEMAV